MLYAPYNGRSHGIGESPDSTGLSFVYTLRKYRVKYHPAVFLDGCATAADWRQAIVRRIEAGVWARAVSKAST